MVDMPKVREMADVMVDADTLWKEIGDFASLGRWHPDVSRVTVSGESGERTRLAYLKTGGEQLERLQAVDAARRMYHYSIERTSLPVRDGVGDFGIETPDPQMSRIVWEVRFALIDDNDDRTVEAIRAFLHDGLARIQAKYRPYASSEAAGVEPHIADADKETRAGTANERVRNTPPAGAWNETSSD